jgi:hypothetical protein
MLGWLILKDVKGTCRCILEAMSLYFLGGPEENHEGFSQDSWCMCRAGTMYQDRYRLPLPPPLSRNRVDAARDLGYSRRFRYMQFSSQNHNCLRNYKMAWPRNVKAFLSRMKRLISEINVTNFVMTSRHCIYFGFRLLMDCFSWIIQIHVIKNLLTEANS